MSSFESGSEGLPDVSGESKDYARARAMIMSVGACMDYVDALGPRIAALGDQIAENYAEYGYRHTFVGFADILAQLCRHSSFYWQDREAGIGHPEHEGLRRALNDNGLYPENNQEFSQFVVMDGLSFGIRFVAMFADAISRRAAVSDGVIIEPQTVLKRPDFAIAMNKLSLTGMTVYTNMIFSNGSERFIRDMSKHVLGEERELWEVLDLNCPGDALSIAVNHDVLHKLGHYMRRQNAGDGSEVARISHAILSTTDQKFSTSGCPAARGEKGVGDPGSGIGRLCLLFAETYETYVSTVDAQKEAYPDRF